MSDECPRFAISDISDGDMFQKSPISDIGCTCKPGNYDDGWQERRSAACVKAEMDAWGQVIAWHRNGDIVKRIRERDER